MPGGIFDALPAESGGILHSCVDGSSAIVRTHAAGRFSPTLPVGYHGNASIAATQFNLRTLSNNAPDVPDRPASVSDIPGHAAGIMIKGSSGALTDWGPGELFLDAAHARSQPLSQARDYRLGRDDAFAFGTPQPDVGRATMTISERF